MPFYHLGNQDIPTNFGKVKWGPPTLSSPTIITLSNTSSGRIANMNKNLDYIVLCPNTITVEGGIQLIGGRNVVFLGGSVNFATDYGTTNGNRALFIKGDPDQQVARTVHVEGFRMAGILREGINIDGQSYNDRPFGQSEPNLTVQLQNINCVDPLLGTEETNHADFVQVYNGPSNLRMDRWFSRSQYQTMFFGPHQFGQAPLGTYELNRGYAEMTDEAGVAFYMVEGSSSADRPTMITDKVYVRHPSRFTFPTNVLFPNPAYWGTGIRPAPQGRQTSHVSSFPGLGYVSPGYEDGTAKLASAGTYAPVAWGKSASLTTGNQGLSGTVTYAYSTDTVSNGSMVLTFSGSGASQSVVSSMPGRAKVKCVVSNGTTSVDVIHCVEFVHPWFRKTSSGYTFAKLHSGTSV